MKNLLIASNPNLQLLYTSRSLIVFMSILIICLGIFIVFQPFLLSYAIAFLLFTFSFLGFHAYRKRREFSSRLELINIHRSAIAAEGFMKFHKKLESYPDANTTFHYRLNPKYTLSLTIFLGLFCLLGIFGAYLELPSTNLFVLIPVFLIFASIYIICLFIIFSQFRPIQIKEREMSSWNGNIQWGDIDIFAYYDIPGLLHEKQFYYEIAGKGTSVSWRDIRDPQSWCESLKPTIPIAEYHQQMQDLVEYICARTGLPLYDLTGPEPVQMYPPLQQTSKHTEDTLLQEQPGEG